MLLSVALADETPVCEAHPVAVSLLAPEAPSTKLRVEVAVVTADCVEVAVVLPAGLPVVLAVGSDDVPGTRLALSLLMALAEAASDAAPDGEADSVAVPLSVLVPDAPETKLCVAVAVPATDCVAAAVALRIVVAVSAPLCVAVCVDVAVLIGVALAAALPVAVALAVLNRGSVGEPVGDGVPLLVPVGVGVPLEAVLVREPEGVRLTEGVGDGLGEGGAHAALAPGATTRTRPYVESATKRRPHRSTATARGEFNRAAAAGPPSPAEPGHGDFAADEPITTPAKVPFAHTFTTRLLPASAANREPQLSTARPRTPLVGTADASSKPGGMAEPAAPVPSTVEMTPAATSMARTLWSSEAYKTAPEGLSASERGPHAKVAPRAGPPSPALLPLTPHVPANTPPMPPEMLRTT